MLEGTVFEGVPQETGSALARDLLFPYQYVKPSDEQLVRMQAVREACKALRSEIEKRSRPCREQALALTKLDECAMWAVKAIPFGDDHKHV